MRKPTRPGVTALADRMTAAIRARRAAGESAPPGLDPEIERRLDALDARMQHLETELEGLQDAVYRQAVREDERRHEMHERTDPERIARELSADARRRGL